jgi:hypothetical protein
MRLCAAWTGACRAGIVTTNFREFLFFPRTSVNSLLPEASTAVRRLRLSVSS